MYILHIFRSIKRKCRSRSTGFSILGKFAATDFSTEFEEWLPSYCCDSNPRPLAHQSSVLLVSQKVRTQAQGQHHTTFLPLFLRAWYSHWQDITGYFPTNPQVRQANPIGHWINNNRPPPSALACIWANTSDTKCDSTKSRTHDLSYRPWPPPSALACIRANTSDTKCDSAKSWAHDLLHTSPAFYR